MLQMLAFTYWVNNAVERAWEVLVQQGPFLYWVATAQACFANRRRCGVGYWGDGCSQGADGLERAGRAISGG